MNRDAIIKKIQALRARAADAASTEAEALMAATKAQELLDKYNLSISETEVRADGVSEAEWDSGQRTRPVVSFACVGIEKLTNTLIYRQGGRIIVVGAPSDVEVALYYLDLTDNAVKSCWKTEQKSQRYNMVANSGRSVRTYGTNFRKGVAHSLGTRFKEMAAQAKPTASQQGTSLVLVKDGMIQSYLHDKGVRLSQSRRQSVGMGFKSGFDAGQGVTISKGVGSSRTSRPMLAA